MSQTFTKTLTVLGGPDQMDITPPFIPDMSTMSVAFTDSPSANGIDNIKCEKASENVCRIKWTTTRSRAASFSVTEVARGDMKPDVSQPAGVLSPSIVSEDS